MFMTKKNTLDSIKQSQQKIDNESILLSIRLSGPIRDLWLNLKEGDLCNRSATKIIHEAIACRAFFGVQEREKQKVSTTITDKDGKTRRLDDVAEYLHLANDE